MQFDWIYFLIIFHVVVFIFNYDSQIRIIHRICNNITRHMQQEQQRKGMIYMMFVLHCFILVYFCSVYITDNLLLKTYYFHTIWHRRASNIICIFHVISSRIKFYWGNCSIFVELISRLLFTELIMGTFDNWPVIKSDSLCWLIYWVSFWYIW